MNLVNESIEEFKRGRSPQKSLNIGANRIMHYPIDWQSLPEGYYLMTDNSMSYPWHLYLEIKRKDGKNMIVSKTKWTKTIDAYQRKQIELLDPEEFDEYNTYDILKFVDKDDPNIIFKTT